MRVVRARLPLFLLAATLASAPALGQVTLVAVDPRDQLGSIQFNRLGEPADREIDTLPFSLKEGDLIRGSSSTAVAQFQCGNGTVTYQGAFRARMKPSPSEGCQLEILPGPAGDSAVYVENEGSTLQDGEVVFGTGGTWFALEVGHDSGDPRRKVVVFESWVWLLRKTPRGKARAAPEHEDRVRRLRDGVCRRVDTSLEVRDDLSRFEETGISDAEYRTAAEVYARAAVDHAIRLGTVTDGSAARAELEALYSAVLRNPGCRTAPGCRRVELATRLYRLGLAHQAILHFDSVRVLERTRLESLGVDPDRLRSLLPERDRRAFDRRLEERRDHAPRPPGRYSIDFDQGLRRGFDGRGQIVSTLSPGHGIGPATYGTIEVSVLGQRRHSGTANPRRAANHAMIYDSTCECGCSGGDPDLGTSTERPPLGNILIVSEDDDSTDPNDASEGGLLSFVFSKPVTIEGLTVKDLEEGGELRFYRHPNSKVSFREQKLSPTGDRDWRRIGGDHGTPAPRANYQKLRPVPGVRRLEVEINGSGAVDNILFALPESGDRPRRN